MTSARKAKRKLSEISFEKEGAHVALVSKDQGGGANGHNYALVLKANKFSPEFVEKMQQVRVTMELPDFLSKFFYLYGDDAKVLATMMGYVEPADTQEMEAEEADSKMQDWIKERMSSFEVLKALHETDDLSSVLSKLDENEYLAMLKDQALIEKAFKKESASSEADTSIASEVKKEEVSASVVEAKVEKSMDEENKVEMVEKSALETLQKALDDQKAELQEAQELIKAFKAEKQAALEKAREEKLSAVVKNSEHAAVLFKAVKSLDDELFAEVLKAFEGMVAVVEKSELFEEKGAQVESQETPVENPVAKALRARLEKQAQAK